MDTHTRSNQRLIPVKTLVSNNKLNTCFDMANVPQKERKQVKRDFKKDEDMVLLIDETILDKLGYIYRI